MKVLIDTNILLDFLCKREPFVNDAEKIFLLGMKQRVQIFICGLSFVNAIYTTRKYGIPQAACVSSLKGLLTFCDVADINRNIISDTLDSGWKDMEDALQYKSGLSSGIECIVTRDRKGFVDAGIPIYSPSALIEFFNS